MSNQERGASIHRRAIHPSLHLEPVVQCLTGAIPLSEPQPDTPPDKAASLKMPLFRYNSKQGTLLISTTAVLSRFSSQREAFQQLRPHRGQGGFLRDVEVPRFGNLWMGSLVPEGTEPSLRKGTQKLEEAIERELDRLCAEHRDLDLGSFYVEQVRQSFEALGRELGINFDLFESKTPIMPMYLGPASKTSRERSKELARLISSREDYQGGEQQNLSRLKEALRKDLRFKGQYTEDEIEQALAHVEHQAQLPESQTSLFLQFLEKDALARLRLAVGFKVMDALSQGALQSAQKKEGQEDKQRFSHYVQRAIGLYEYLADKENDAIEIQLGHSFSGGDFVLNEEASKVTFYQCLPVWCEWNAQLFEAQKFNDKGLQISREISYRFRVNGKNPEEQKSSFLVRLDKIEQTLFPEKEDDEPRFAQRRLAELFVLAVLVTQEAPSAPEDSVQRLKKILQYVEKNGKDGVRKILEELKKRAEVMEQIASGSVQTLRSPGTVFLEMFERSWTFHLNVVRGAVSSSKLATLSDDFFLCDHRKSLHHFFNLIEVEEETKSSPSLFSIPVRVTLSEQSLKSDQSPYSLEFQREAPEKMIQIFWMPSQLGQDGRLEGTPLSKGKRERWQMGEAILIEYIDKYLRKGQTTPEARQLLAAYRCGFTILVYTTLRVLLRRIAREEERKPHILMMRMQDQGRSGNDTESEFVYAASHAIEFALGDNYHCKLQGISHDNQRNEKYKSRNVYAALGSAFPLRFASGNIGNERVALIAFGARPCDSHPQGEQDAETYLLLMKTYVLEPTEDGGLRFQLDRSQTTVKKGSIALEQPALVAEEIARLSGLGYRHIFYMTHRMGTRRLGRSIEEQRFHDNADFLNHLGQNFPGLFLYPIVRDVFPATRLQKVQRTKEMKGFEIAGVEAHQSEAQQSDLHASYLPIYTIATLAVAGGDEEKRPQSGFSTYFLLYDQDPKSRMRIHRIFENLQAESSVRPLLFAILRAVHVFECEKLPLHGQADLVLEPYKWMHPDSIEEVGELKALSSRSRLGHVILSLPAVLNRIGKTLRGEERTSHNEVDP